jgi:hypothetical protein
MVIEQTSSRAAGRAWAKEPMRDRVDSARILLDTDPSRRRVRSVLECVAAGTKSATSIAQPTGSERAKVKKLLAAHGANVAEAVIAVGCNAPRR